MRRLLKEVTFILILASVSGMTANFLRRDGVNLFQAYRSDPVPESENAGGFPVVSIPEAIDAFRKGSALFLDAREPSFYKAGHIPGALNMPLSRFAASFPGLKNKLLSSSGVIIYCSGVSCDTSRKLAEKLLFEGIEKVRVFAGGMEAWKKSNLPVEYALQ